MKIMDIFKLMKLSLQQTKINDDVDALISWIISSTSNTLKLEIKILKNDGYKNIDASFK